MAGTHPRSGYSFFRDLPSSRRKVTPSTSVSNSILSPKTKTRDERSRRLAFPQADSAPKSIPSPGTKISTPVFGSELFVAHLPFRSERRKMQL
jgi:hypothetical protein